MRELSEAAPRLVDTVHRDLIVKRLGAIGDEIEAELPELAYAEGALAVGRHDLTDATKWLVRAQSKVDISQPELVARIAFELGYVCLARSEFVSADAVLAWAESVLGTQAARAADVLHLRALMADRRGDYGDAASLYRQAISGSTSALTPLTRVLAMINLAVALHHREPAESVSLCALSRETIEAEGLHPGIRSALDNITGYALICRGELDHAQATLEAAAAAATISSPLVHRFANFNLAIVEELRGELDSAARRLTRLDEVAATDGSQEFAGWVALRLAWVELRQGRIHDAEARSRRTFGAHLPRHLDQVVPVLQALIAYEHGQFQTAREPLVRMADLASERGDDLSVFALRLWLAALEEKSGRTLAARRALKRAWVLGRARGFRLSPNWWASDLVDCARRLSDDETAEFFDALIAPPQPADEVRRTARVEIDPGGVISVDSRPVPDDLWREGRTGPHVLRRLFSHLIRAFPAGLTREDLCDRLWPDSEGDRAVSNLYAATNDLRRLLGSVPGLRVRSSEGGLRLDADTNVTIKGVRQSGRADHATPREGSPSGRGSGAARA